VYRGDDGPGMNHEGEGEQHGPIAVCGDKALAGTAFRAPRRKVATMSGGPHPLIAITDAERHRAETYGWTMSDRQRLIAELDAEDHRRWVSLSAVLLIVAVLTLVMAMSGAVS
jgi:hypothetical protein